PLLAGAPRLFGVEPGTAAIVLEIGLGAQPAVAQLGRALGGRGRRARAAAGRRGGRCLLATFPGRRIGGDRILGRMRPLSRRTVLHPSNSVSLAPTMSTTARARA